GPIGSADSVSFVMQAGGTGALGGGGGGGGYAGIGNSFAIKFDLYSGGTHIPTTGLYTGGDNPRLAPRGQSLALSPISLTSSHPLRVTLTYDGTTLHQTVLDTVTLQTFTHDYPLNLAMVLGSTSALVGFTGGTGGETATQDILNWTGSFP